MRPEQIKARLEERKTSLAAISRELSVSKVSLTNVVKGGLRSARIEAAIANALSKPLHEVFPDRYSAPEGYQEPAMVSISATELADIRQSLARATQVIERFCA
jgi:lambda repressor-like predicted transcriptional regulator